MKLLVATLAVAVAVAAASASPALAKSKKKHVASPVYYGSAVVPRHYSRSYGPGSLWTSPHVYGPSGRYVGSDPDFRVRLEMSKDAWEGDVR